MSFTKLFYYKFQCWYTKTEFDGPTRPKPGTGLLNAVNFILKRFGHEINIFYIISATRRNCPLARWRIFLVSIVQCLVNNLFTDHFTLYRDIF